MSGLTYGHGPPSRSPQRWLENASGQPLTGQSGYITVYPLIQYPDWLTGLHDRPCVLVALVPFGTSFSLRVGQQPPPVAHQAGCKTDCRCEIPPNRMPGFLLDVNPPLGEPNRLYLWLGRWHVTLGLPSVREFRETGRDRTAGRNGREITTVHGEHFSNWLHPHIDGCDRYRYHRDGDGKWIRNDKPEPFHWGWLTIERSRQ